MAALLEEVDIRQSYLEGEPVETIYLGGGTPSLLSDDELKDIMAKLRTSFVIDPAAEITMEANPDDITMAGKPASWAMAGINRLSIGIQSFFEGDLQWMNRAHTAGQALDSIRVAKDEGFDNISIDLIYGSPTLSDAHWAKNVEQAVQLNIPHLSCYALTVEPRTALDKMIHQHKKAPVDPDHQARQFLLLMDWLEQAGYEHYEISNFAVPGKRSRHNSSYWKGRKYLGLGPSAHSYDGVSRQWNIANNALYSGAVMGMRAAAKAEQALNGEPIANGAYSGHIAPAGGDQVLFEKEVLTPVQQLNEYIMISLRTMEGCDTDLVSARFGEAAGLELVRRANRYIAEGKMMLEYAEKSGEVGLEGTDVQEGTDVREGAELQEGAKLQEGAELQEDEKMRLNGQRLVLTKEGKLLADGIAADLFH